MDINTFSKSRNEDDNQRKVVVVDGARFVYTSEVADGHRLNEQLVKDITGRDTMEGRRLYHEAFNFPVQLKPWMYGNYKPDIRGTDDAIWDRVKLIEFNVSFKDDPNLDLELPEKLLKELPGILNWVIKGCLDWQTSGLRPPEKVTIATKAYRKEQDTIAQFIDERCDVLPAASTKAARLYKAYQSWCETEGYETFTQKRFGAYLTAHGYPSDENESGRGAIRQGLDLKKPPTKDDETATHHDSMGSSDNSNNDNKKAPESTTNATLATHRNGKEAHAYAGEGKGGTKGSKGSNDTVKPDETQQRRGEACATLSSAKGSRGTHPPQFCPGCGKAPTWLVRGAFFVCHMCKGQVPREEVSR